MLVITVPGRTGVLHWRSVRLR